MVLQTTGLSTSESDLDDSDCGALIDRNDQRDSMIQTSSSDSTQSWSQLPNQNAHKIRGFKQVITLCGGMVPESFYRSHFSVVATLDLPVHQMVKRSQSFIDEASKDAGTS